MPHTNMKVKMYTTPACVYCKMAKEYFIANNVDYEEIDVVKNVSAREEIITRTNQRGVPVFEINGSYMVGFNRARLSEALGLSA